MRARPFRNTDHRYPDRACLHCGKTFTPDVAARTLCSDECANTRRAQQARMHQGTYHPSPKNDTRLPDVERERLKRRLREAMEDGLRMPELRSRFGPSTESLAREVRAEMKGCGV